jgi:hypothetical protein
VLVDVCDDVLGYGKIVTDIACNIVSKNKTKTKHYSQFTKPRLNGN